MFFRYVLRSVLSRKASNGITVLAIGGVIGGCMLMLIFVNSLHQLLLVTGLPDNVVVLSQGARSENTSILSKPQLDQIKVLPGIRSADGVALASPELVKGGLFLEPIGGGSSEVVLRGVEPIAYAVHRQVKVTAGRVPAEHASEVMIGQQVARQYKDMAIGQTVPIGTKRWPIVGVFEAGGGAFESEIWSTRDPLATQLKVPNLSSVAVAVQSPEGVAPLVALMADRPTLRLAAMSERDYYMQAVAQLPALIRTVSFIILVLFLGAVFAATNSLHASFLGRMPEFATMNVLGFRRGKLSWLLMQESLFLALLGTVIGCGAASLIDVDITGLGQVSKVATIGNLTPLSLAEGAAIGLAIGILGGLLPLILVRRFDVLRTLA